MVLILQLKFSTFNLFLIPLLIDTLSIQKKKVNFYFHLSEKKPPTPKKNQTPKTPATKKTPKKAQPKFPKGKGKLAKSLDPTVFPSFGQLAILYILSFL